MQSAMMMQVKFASNRAVNYAPPALLAIAQREGEDAKLCGLTRSLDRRLLALNMPRSMQTQRKPIVSAAYSALAEKRIA